MLLKKYWLAILIQFCVHYFFQLKSVNFRYCLVFRKHLFSLSYVSVLLSLVVSICLDVVSIEISISTPKKYQSRRSRKSRRFSKVSLDDREISIEIEISRFSLDRHCQDSTSWSRSRLIETYRDFSDFLWFLWISRFFSRSRSRNSVFLQISRSRF